ncbi:MAG: hypothetical protein CME71_01175 [Halobacteriovorax sp.]|nr:hypothetical protein [Halobacteriovorax sp.]
MKPLIAIYLVFLGLFYANQYLLESKARKRQVPAWAQWTFYELKDRHDSITLASFHTASVTGHKIKMPRRLKKILNSLHIEHLATPSGLHLSLLTSLFFPFLGRIARLSFLAPIFTLNEFYSLKRIALFKAIGITSPKLNRLKAFYIVMTTDLLLGSASSSPYSFLFGFLFLGSIIATTNKSILSSQFIPFALLGAQCLIAYCLDQPLYLSGFFLGLVITSLFSFLFPLLVLDILLLKLSAWPMWSVSHWALELWWKAVLLASKISLHQGPQQISFLVIIALFLILLKYYKLAGLLLLLNFTPLWNAPTKRDWRTDTIRPEKPISIKQKRYGFETIHEKKRRCTHRHRPIGYEIKCL